jgi:hypothetical protein
MTAPSELVTKAQAFRVDVYSTSASCADAGGPSGSPVYTRTFAAGTPIELNVPAGRRPVVLTAFADSALEQTLGRACTDADFGAGQKVCLDLTIDAVDLATKTDGAVAACDPTMPASCGALTCCGGACLDVSGDIQHCGGCRACASTEVATPVCTSGLCEPMCQAGYADCIHPAAPAADDGCETAITTTTSCGACGHACSTANVQTAACTSGLCAPTCKSGFVSCKTPVAPAADDGCECVGTGCCNGTSCQTQHGNGLSDNFFDCVALGTYTSAQAVEARSAWNVTVVEDFVDTTSCGDMTPMECRQTASMCACWGYSTGTATGGTGHVHLNPSTNGCMCPTAGDPQWN